MIFKRLRAFRNSHVLLSLCSQIIRRYEYGCVSSCKDDLLQAIKTAVKADPSIASWEDETTNYEKLAHVCIANKAFDLLASGRYHIYTGTLNPVGCAPSLLRVYTAAISWACTNRFITEEERDQQLALLSDRIGSVG